MLQSVSHSLFSAGLRWNLAPDARNDRKTPLTAADLLNDRVIPYEEYGIFLQRVLTDHGTEYCGSYDRHEYELYLAVEDIDHTPTKTKSPQTTLVIDKCFLLASG
jgi:hypothetical protein